jgi:hypothetical protein
MEASAEGQLRLDLDEGRQEDVSVPGIDLAETYLAAHGGDAVAAIRDLLLDADFLREQLWTASQMMSAGMGRGWRPKYERA